VRTTSDLIVRLYDEPLVAVNYARAASAAFNEARRLINRDLVLVPVESPNVPTSLHRVEIEIAEDLHIVRARIRGERITRALDQAEMAIAAWFRDNGMLMAHRQKAVTALPMRDAIDRRASEATAGLDDVVELVAADGFGYRARAEHTMLASSITLAGLAGGIVIASALVVLLFGYLLIGPVRAATRVAEDIALGRVATVPVTVRRDEIGRLLKSLSIMRTNLCDREMRAQELLRERERTAETLRRTNTRFDIALNNMSHGLLMCDGDGQVIVVNRRFHDIYGIVPNSVRLGCTYHDVVALSIAAGNYPGRTTDEVMVERASVLETNERRVLTRSLNGDRTIMISYDPIPDGGWIAIHEDITVRRRSEEQIAFLARHDPLTELPNRMFLRERLTQALALAGRGQGFALLCLDLDQFKSVNDTLGHPVGDSLLRAVADRLRKLLRDGDLVARLGGDEFAIIQLGASRRDAALALARRVVERVSEPYEIDGHRVVIGVSVGVTLAPTDGTDPARLFRNADLALYRAKQTGRGTWCAFEPELETSANARRTIERDLRDALPMGQLQLHYQPVLCSRTRGVTGFEALLRWHHPVRGMVPPAEFIPVAEEIGVIVPIGIWALHQACREAATWPGHLRVAVNVSSLQFRSQTFVTTVADALQRAGIAPARLELEITESIMLQNDQVTLSAMRALRAFGVRIAMDDFGTGYSSLSYLRGFPFNTIKIDKSFVDGVEQAESAAIIQAIVGLGRALHMDITAEGVETEEQLEILVGAGCTALQGYLFSRPVAASELLALITRFSGPPYPVHLPRGEISDQNPDADQHNVYQGKAVAETAAGQITTRSIAGP
jgi:diguanylate cyclase (GGDEF)-like protein